MKIILNGKLQIQITQYFLSYKPFYFKIDCIIYDFVTHTKFTSRKKNLQNDTIYKARKNI